MKWASARIRAERGWVLGGSGAAAAVWAHNRMPCRSREFPGTTDRWGPSCKSVPMPKHTWPCRTSGAASQQLRRLQTVAAAQMDRPSCRPRPACTKNSARMAEPK